ncbi:putative serine protease F56F10.1 isoform X2 [Tubulanus polymorphus]
MSISKHNGITTLAPVFLLMISAFGTLTFVVGDATQALHQTGKIASKKNGILVLPPPPKPEGTTLPKDEWFVQKLDHFNDADTRMWNQRFFRNATFYKPTSAGVSVVFLMIGGEGPANPVWMVTGQWIKYAQIFNAYCLMLEHRFYGKSHPTANASTQNLQHLSSEQALADLANFRASMAEKLGFKNSKWIVFGGSYPGSLAAWFRLKYPHLVDGAVAASAPVFAQLNFKNYLAVVQDAFGPTCSGAFAKGTQTIEQLLLHQTGARIVSSTFKTCKPIMITSQMDVWNFYSILAGNIENVVQYNKDNRAFEGALGTNITVDVVCKMMMTTSDKFQGLADVSNLLLAADKQKCLDNSYADLVKSLKSTDWNDDIAGRSWVYQTCTEFGFFQSSDLPNQPFGPNFPLKFFVQQCVDVFGEKFNSTFIADGVHRTNINYGGYDITKVTKVIFYNGSVDPWHALGVPKSSRSAAYVTGTAHCANMYPDSSNDLPALINVRKREVNLIHQWLQ